MKNIASQSEFFQALQQLKHVGQKGEISAVDKATLVGPRPPLELLYIPANERRSFQLVYQIPADETRRRVTYLAVTAGASKVLELPALGEKHNSTP